MKSADIQNTLRQVLTISLSFILVLNSLFLNTTPARANPSRIDPDGTTGTTIDLSPNNLSIVNIADPNSNGVSMNNFDNFNVDQTGAIINNSNIDINTQLGGWIYANTNISQHSNHQATVIIGEVTGNNMSQILGYMEIAGGNAQFILLNPNGIACNGCGFINTNNLILGTGSSVYNNGSLSAINMGSGNITISGNGLDGTTINNSLNLISKNININAPIWAQNILNLYQGSSTFNTGTSQFTTSQNNQNTQNNTVGIDASALDSMYANKVTIIASDTSVGVRSSANIIAYQNGMILEANGDITYNNISSNGDVNITSTQNITQNGKLLSNSNIEIIANNITNNSLIASNGNTILASQNNITNSTNAAISSNATLGLYADNTITNNAIILSQSTLTIAGYNNNSALILNNGSTTQAAYISKAT